jgi:hypothetical protein
MTGERRVPSVERSAAEVQRKFDPMRNCQLRSSSRLTPADRRHEDVVPPGLPPELDGALHRARAPSRLARKCVEADLRAAQVEARSADRRRKTGGDWSGRRR